MGFEEQFAGVHPELRRGAGEKEEELRLQEKSRSERSNGIES